MIYKVWDSWGELVEKDGCGWKDHPDIYPTPILLPACQSFRLFFSLLPVSYSMIKCRWAERQRRSGMFPVWKWWGQFVKQLVFHWDSNFCSWFCDFEVTMWGAPTLRSFPLGGWSIWKEGLPKSTGNPTTGQRLKRKGIHCVQEIADLLSWFKKLSVTAKIWSQPRSPLIGEWLKKMGYIYMWYLDIYLYKSHLYVYTHTYTQWNIIEA